MENQKKKFRLFKNDLNGKGVPKGEDETRNFKFFFKLLWRKINTLLSVNMLMLFANFPLFFILLGFSGNLNTTSYAPVSRMYGPIQGAIQAGAKFTNTTLQALTGAHTFEIKLSVPTTATYIMFGIGALIIFTFGLSMVGTTYIVRNIVKGEPVFLMSDFFYAIKRNWKQGLIFGIIDISISFLIVFDIIVYAFNATTFMQSAIFFTSLIIGLIYFIMRFYIYVMMVTFDLSIYKLLKNALIFSVIGLKRNILALLGIVIFVYLNYCLFLIFPPLGLIMPFILTPAVCQFTAIYASYPKIYSIMIEPYEEKEETPQEAPIFKDMG